ncbi:hypothetical protein TWF281_006826 [Arthrobotrys megalospora]
MSSINNPNRPGHSSTSSQPPPCKYFSKGQCARGNACRYYHDVNLLDYDDLEIIQVNEADLDSLVSDYDGDLDGPISLSEIKPEAIAYRKYQHPPTPSSQLLSFKDLKSYNKSRLTPAYTHLQFGTGFPVTDAHIKDLLTCPQMLTSLEVFIIKGIDGTSTTTGKGKKKKTTTTDPKPIEISNEPLITVIQKCPNLRVIHLIGCINLDDFVFKAISESCPDLVELKVTGIPTQPGRLTSTSPVYLVTKGHSALRDIREIHLTNQSIDPEGITLLSDARPIANILEGVQSLLPNKGVGLTLTSFEGTKVHHSSYIVAVENEKFKFKDCYAPLWNINKGEEPSHESMEFLLDRSKGPPGFWADETNGSDGSEWESMSDDSEEADEGIHRIEIIKGDPVQSERLPDDHIKGLAEAIKRLHRNIGDPVVPDEGRFEEIE